MRKMSQEEWVWLRRFDAVMKGYVDLIPKIADLSKTDLKKMKLDLNRERNSRRRDVYKTNIREGFSAECYLESRSYSDYLVLSRESDI